MTSLTRQFVVDGSFARAGDASSRLKKMLKDLGFPQDIVRRVAVASYEAEINMVIHANGGTITATVSPAEIELVFADRGPGIPNIERAMQAGWSTASQTARAMGFGAGMGLPNIKKFSDDFLLETEIGIGTVLTVRIRTGKD